MSRHKILLREINMTSERLSTERVEHLINNVLKEDLRKLEAEITKYNAEIMEFVQLKNTIQAMQQNVPSSFKTQMNIGGNLFMEAKVENTDKVNVDIGLGYYVQFSLEDAIKYANFKIKLLTKECDVVREESVKKRAEIKISLLYLGDRQEAY